MNRSSRIFVAGGDTLIGSALLEHLRASGYDHLVGTPPDEPDLTAPGQVEDFFAEARPDYVFLAAGKSGGIQANVALPAEMMLNNLLIAAHVMSSAHSHGVKKLLYLASSCSYPRDAAQPLRVDSLMTGPLEPTSEAYATAKLAGIKLCQAYQRQYGDRFVVGIPANTFGPHDDFGHDSGHVVPALLRRIHEARARGDRQVTVWGTGTPRREFVWVRDLADACLFVMEKYDDPRPINLSGGTDLSIAEVARAVADVVGFRGRIELDASKPDGAPFKALDSGPLRSLGWRARTPFAAALEETYEWYLRHVVKEDARDVFATV